MIFCGASHLRKPENKNIRHPAWCGLFFWRWALVVVVLAGIWGPHYAHFWVDRSPASPHTAPLAASSPTDVVLDEVARMRLGVQLQMREAEVVPWAERVVAGRLYAPEFLQEPMALADYPADFGVGTSTFQLFVAGLGIEDLLLDAYERSGRPAFRDLALRRTLSFAKAESAQFAPTGFLWNDHAVAARVSVLARLWRHVRSDGAVGEDARREILSLVLLTGRLLAEPGHFTVRTNHGAMQNVALLQIGAAFPALPDVPEWRALALERLTLQLPFYVSPEGMVLEHSAGYHAFGAMLLAQAVRLCAMNGLAPPSLLIQAAESSRVILGRLVRPDGSLPLIGNTVAQPIAGIPYVQADGGDPIRMLPVPTPTPDGLLLPVSGYAIWWNWGSGNAPSQTVLTWARHEGHGHKHADEMALTFWSRDTDWITNTGYWPYGRPGEADAYGWPGANAPHFVGEGFSSRRSASVTAVGEREGMRFIEMARSNSDGAVFRRQVIQLDADRLLVLDFTDAKGRAVETLWTSAPEIGLRDREAGRSWSTGPNPNGSRLAVSIVSRPVASTSLLSASAAPFGGWVVRAQGPVPATSLRVVTEPAPSSVATLFQVGEAAAPADEIAFIGEPSADAWALRITASAGPVTITRSGSALTLHGPGSVAIPTMLIELQAPPDIALQARQLKDAYQGAVSRFEPWRDVSVYRRKVSMAALGLGLAIEALWLVLLRLRPPTARTHGLRLHVIYTACWMAIGGWLFLVYFP